MLLAVLCACSPVTCVSGCFAGVRPADITHLDHVALSWPGPWTHDGTRGIRPFEDGTAFPHRGEAITRAILRTNSRIAPTAALMLAVQTVQAARASRLPPEFLAATLLQESAYDPRAVSVDGALGIAQFMPSTAAQMGVNPFQPVASIDAAAQLLGSYVRTYRGRAQSPYWLALAAYNAGPGAVAYYHGIPPYRETHTYVRLIFERWVAMLLAEGPR